MKIIAIVFTLIFIISATYLIIEYFVARKEFSEYSKIQTDFASIPMIEIHSSDEKYHLETDPLPYLRIDFGALLRENPDTVGWLHIPDTLISYPVVQTTNNSKYLDTSFLGTRSSAGAVFADMNNDVKAPDQNVVLYGHNMGSGRKDMFGTLLEYKDHAHYDTHRYVQFDTIYAQHGWWKIFAVVNHDIRNTNWNYLQLKFETQDDFLVWISQARALSLHYTDTILQADDQILTLSTCDRSIYGKDGRLVILAVKIEGDENI
ncbi:class B sortase [Christensenellaceae bacterium OttesenSCG-928-K19]|nr:class B sortase [Christensenellaceae bacterium OttesenSCG-928-K19]